MIPFAMLLTRVQSVDAQRLWLSAHRWAERWQFPRPQIDFRSPHYYIATFPLHSRCGGQVKASSSSPSPLSEGDLPTKCPLRLHLLAVLHVVAGNAENFETAAADAVRIWNRFVFFCSDDAEFLDREEEGGRHREDGFDSRILLRQGASGTGTICLFQFQIIFMFFIIWGFYMTILLLTSTLQRSAKFLFPGCVYFWRALPG